MSFQTLKAIQKNVLISEEKQVTERFTQAINQLGSEKTEVRIGGIYALERIAKDSPKDHWNIVEVLSSFIRDKSPVSKRQATRSPAIDVQAALTVIGRRNADKELPQQCIDLERTNLNRVKLRGANFSRARLAGCTFVGAEISDSDFSKTVLHKVGLDKMEQYEMSQYGLDSDENADLSNAFLYNVNFSEANLTKAVFEEATLNNVDFSDAVLSRAEFTSTSFTDIKFIKANLYKCDFSSATFQHIEGHINFIEAIAKCQLHWPTRCAADAVILRCLHNPPSRSAL